MKTRSNVLMSLAAVVFLGSLVGCDNLTTERYEMITVNVDKEFDVQKMIGSPDNRLGDRWHYERVDKHLNVFIDFDETGTVTRKQWIDADTQVWGDTEDPGDESSYESTKIRKSNQ